MSADSDKVLNIICDRLGVTRDRLKPDTRFVDDLGADSLDIVEIVMELEEEFEVTIPEEDAERIQTVGEAINYIEENAKAINKD